LTKARTGAYACFPSHGSTVVRSCSETGRALS
jgi:hypothetical protein